jgi:hypothetical protein
VDSDGEPALDEAVDDGGLGAGALGARSLGAGADAAVTGAEEADPPAVTPEAGAGVGAEPEDTNPPAMDVAAERGAVSEVGVPAPSDEDVAGSSLEEDVGSAMRA